MKDFKKQIEHNHKQIEIIIKLEKALSSKQEAENIRVYLYDNNGKKLLDGTFDSRRIDSNWTGAFLIPPLNSVTSLYFQLIIEWEDKLYDGYVFKVSQKSIEVSE